MEIFQIILLAIVQGITEFLPISSQSHIILMSKLMEMDDQGLGFDIALHAGSLLAILIYYRRELNQALSFTDEGKSYIKLIIIGSIPLPIVALIFMDFVSIHFRSINSIAYITIIFAVLLYFSDMRKKDQYRNLKSIGIYIIIFIGFMQTLAIIPGVSRSGIVITAALLANFSREDSIRIAFILSIPAIFMATTYQSFQLYELKNYNILTDHLIGVLISFLVSYITIHLFITTINRISFTPYIVYRIILGFVLLGI